MNTQVLMHELGLAENILDIVRKSVPVGRESAVKTIRLRVGRFAGVVPDSLKFCLDALSGDKGMSNAVLLIEHTPLSASCGSCGNISEVKDYIFRCPSCGSENMEIVSGNELEIVEIELEETL